MLDPTAALTRAAGSQLPHTDNVGKEVNLLSLSSPPHSEGTDEPFAFAMQHPSRPDSFRLATAGLEPGARVRVQLAHCTHSIIVTVPMVAVPYIVFKPKNSRCVKGDCSRKTSMFISAAPVAIPPDLSLSRLEPSASPSAQAATLVVDEYHRRMAAAESARMPVDVSPLPDVKQVVAAEVAKNDAPMGNAAAAEAVMEEAAEAEAAAAALAAVVAVAEQQRPIDPHHHTEPPHHEQLLQHQPDTPRACVAPPDLSPAPRRETRQQRGRHVSHEGTNGEDNTRRSTRQGARALATVPDTSAGESTTRGGARKRHLQATANAQSGSESRGGGGKQAGAAAPGGEGERVGSARTSKRARRGLAGEGGGEMGEKKVDAAEKEDNVEKRHLEERVSEGIFIEAIDEDNEGSEGSDGELPGGSTALVLVSRQLRASSAQDGTGEGSGLEVVKVGDASYSLRLSETTSSGYANVWEEGWKGLKR